MYEDPAAVLNVTERRWNQMVQEDIKKHKDEEQRKVLEKYQKNREVMEEQKKQIEARRKVDGK